MHDDFCWVIAKDDDDDDDDVLANMMTAKRF